MGSIYCTKTMGLIYCTTNVKGIQRDRKILTRKIKTNIEHSFSLHVVEKAMFERSVKVGSTNTK